MRVLKQLAGTGTFRGLPLLLLAYAALMTHFIFGRAFRDSLLGSHLSIDSLPYLTLWSTVISVIVSLTVSNLLRSTRRARIARAIYGINVVIELLFALSSSRLRWLYSLFFIDVSASTLIGISMIWILIGDWASSCHADRSRLIPSVMLFGTATSILAGVGLTHLRMATSFQSANLMLAAMNLIPVVALLFHNNEGCVPRRGFTFEDLQNQAFVPNKLLRKFALLVVVAAMTSTLLDLMFRIRVAEHYVYQSDRYIFLVFSKACLTFAPSFPSLRLAVFFKRSWFWPLFICTPRSSASPVACSLSRRDSGYSRACVAGNTHCGIHFSASVQRWLTPVFPMKSERPLGL